MAGDWIKMRCDLPDDPAVIGIAAKLDLDEFAVVGRLHAFWAWVDRQSRDGHALGVTASWLDRKLQRDGFAQAMVDVGWLVIGPNGIEIPNFERHNGKTAKDRGLANNRQQARRGNVTPDVTQLKRDPSRNVRDNSVTREEKRREEQELPPLPPKGGAEPKSAAGKRGKPKLPMPDDFAVPAEWQAAAEAKFPDVDWATEAVRFVSHHRSKASVSADWRQSWTTWVHGPYEKSRKRRAATSAPASNGYVPMPGEF